MEPNDEIRRLLIQSYMNDGYSLEKSIQYVDTCIVEVIDNEVTVTGDSFKDTFQIQYKPFLTQTS